MTAVQLLLIFFTILLVFYFLISIINGHDLPLREIVIVGVTLLVVSGVYCFLVFVQAQGTADLITNQCGGEMTPLTIIFHEQEAADLLGYCMTGVDS